MAGECSTTEACPKPRSSSHLLSSTQLKPSVFFLDETGFPVPKADLELAKQAMDGFEGAILLPPPPFPQVLGFRRTTCSFFFSEAVSHHSPGWLWTWALASQMLKLQVCTSIHTTFGVLFCLIQGSSVQTWLALGSQGLMGLEAAPAPRTVPSFSHAGFTTHSVYPTRCAHSWSEAGVREAKALPRSYFSSSQIYF